MPSFEFSHKPDIPPENNESAGRQLVTEGLQGLREYMQTRPSEIPTAEGNIATAEGIRYGIEAIFEGINVDSLLPTEGVRRAENKALFEAALAWPPEKYATQDVQGPKLYTIEISSLPLQKTILFLPLEGSILRVDHDSLSKGVLDYQRLRLEKIYLAAGDNNDHAFAGAWSLYFSINAQGTDSLLHLIGPDRRTIPDQATIQRVLRESAVELYSGITAILPERN